MDRPQDDQRSDFELFRVALASEDDEAQWDAIAALHWRGSRDILDRARALCQSHNAKERSVGADVIGQLGIPTRSFPDESFEQLLCLLEDTDEGVICSTIFALHHVDDERAVGHVLRFVGHPNPDIRYAATSAFCGVEDDAAITALLILAGDKDDRVRDWATFGLGRQCSVNSPEIRDALAARLADHDEDVRYEAVLGLARCRDARALPFLKTMLHEDPDDIFVKEAAANFLGLEDAEEIGTAELLGIMQRRQTWTNRKG